MSNSTITLQAVVNLAATHADLLPLAGVGGYSNEPALSLCNDVLSELSAQPSAWKFNRGEMALFVTAPFRQDYQFGGAVAFTAAGGGAGIALATASTPGISRTGTTVTVTTLEAHNLTIGDTVYLFGNADAQFNSVYSQTPTSSGYSGGWVILTTPTTTSFTFTHITAGTTTSGASGITDFGWLESATMREINSASPIPRIWDVEAVNDIHPTSLSANPKKVCVLNDNGDGTLKIRFQYVPGNVFFGVSLVYQRQMPLKTQLSDLWAPFPDRYSFVYRQFFLARCYRYINSPRADVEYQKANAVLGKAMGLDDAEQGDQHIYPERSLMSQADGGYDDF